MMTSSYSGLKKRGLINDCISDMLTRIRNATLAKKSIVFIPCTQLNLQIAQILEKEGFIQNFQVLRGPNPLKNVQLNTSNVSNSLSSVVSSNSTSTKKEEVISHLPNVNENIRNWDSTEKVNTLNKSCELQEILIRLKYRSKKIYNGKTKESCITNLKRLSKPGLRIYTNYKEIPRILGGTGLVILSTPQGLLTDREARSLKIGGELLCFVW